MAPVIWLIGMLAVVLGGWTVWNPKLMVHLLRWNQKGIVFYQVSITKAAFGVIMLVWARSCSHPVVIIILGVITLVTSAAAIATSRAQTQRLMNFFLRQSSWFHRLWGLLGMITGILIIWAGWPK